MSDVVGVRLKRAGRVYYFSPAGLELKVGDTVVVDTTRGQKLGQVVIAPKQVLENELTEPLKPVVRLATPGDVKRAEELPGKEEEALVEANKIVARMQLPMKLLSADYGLDGSKLTVYFKAEQRVDFRALVQELSGHLKVRVELRQVGPRDEAKLVGDFGKCGRCLCCTSFLTEFAPVSIKMAKEQDLPLNPQKISGACGRLQCCLTYENETYKAMRQNLPRRGAKVATANGPALVCGCNVLKQTILAQLESEATVELPVGEITVIEDRRPQPQPAKAAQPQDRRGRRPEAGKTERPESNMPARAEAVTSEESKVPDEEPSSGEAVRP